jgi:hypothetical protein
VNDLILKAGLQTSPRPRDDDWQLVMRAGVYEIGRKCDQYLDALFRFNREQRASRQGLAAAAAASGAIMGIAGATVEALAITAASFGLASSLFDASVNSVLFTIEPSALRNVALQGREKYLNKLRDVEINTRPDMLIALQGYLTQCSPAAIEANINNAASGAPSVVTPSLNNDVAQASAALAAPGTVLLRPAPLTGTSRAAPTPPPRSTVSGALSPFEQRLNQVRGQMIEKALCLAPDTLGRVTFGPSVRQAITRFRETTTGRTAGAKPPVRPGDGLSPNEGLVLEGASPCPTQCYKNAFEYFQYGPFAGIGPDLMPRPKTQGLILQDLGQLIAWATGDKQAEATLVDFCAPASRGLIDRALQTEKLPAEARLSPGSPLSRNFVESLRAAQRADQQRQSGQNPEASPESGSR